MSDEIAEKALALEPLMGRWWTSMDSKVVPEEDSISNFKYMI
jgi:hypothetical protein